MPYRLALLAILVGSLLPISGVAAEPVFHRNFDGPQTSWQVLETGVPARIGAHEIMPGGARDDAGAERIVVAATAGQSLLLVTPTATLAVLDELEVRLWLKAGRPDVQLAARIILPRTAQGGGAASVIVRGATYNRPGQWQQLVLKDVPKLLAAQIRVMRATPGAAGRSIDPREAFVDAVVLICPGEPGGVEIMTDELQVDGIIYAAAESVQLAGYSTVTPATAAANPPAVSSHARLQGGTLFIDDKPFVPRVIRWQGEPLAFLAERGFNVIQLPGPPTGEQIGEAARHALWFVCSPPRPEALAGERRLGHVDDRVLAWHLDDAADGIDPNYALRWAELIRERDGVSGRPVVIAPQADWPAASKTANVLLARHPRTGVISGADFDRWLGERPRLARPGTPLWAFFATQFDDAVGRQCASLAGVEMAAPSVDGERLELLVRLACAHGVRGFVFDSRSSLVATDAATRQRAATLELINRRIQLIEPWLAAGNVVGRVASADGAWIGVVLHVDRARLLIPLAEPAAGDGVTPAHPTPAAGSETAFVVPGVAESSQALAFTPAALRALSAQRVAGGLRFVLPSPGDGFVLITEDPPVIQSLRQRTARDGPHSIRLQRDLVAMRAATIADTAHRLTQLGYPHDPARSTVWVTAQLPQVDGLLAAGRVEQAQRVVAAASVVLEQAAAGQRAAVGAATSFESNPLALSYAHLADYAVLERALRAHRGGENLLYGGDFENLDQMTQFGWQHVRHPLPGIETRAELSATEPQQGGYCLELHARSTAATSPAQPVITSAPVWIQSPPMAVSAGQFVEITGWVRIDESIGGGDGLQIVDSLAGAELSLAIRETSGWQPFRMIRAVPESSELRLTFALAGLGTARIDAVMVRALEQPTPQP